SRRSTCRRAASAAGRCTRSSSAAVSSRLARGQELDLVLPHRLAGPRAVGLTPLLDEENLLARGLVLPPAAALRGAGGGRAGERGQVALEARRGGAAAAELPARAVEVEGLGRVAGDVEAARGGEDADGRLTAPLEADEQ